MNGGESSKGWDQSAESRRMSVLKIVSASILLLTRLAAAASLPLPASYEFRGGQRLDQTNS
jgi:hypothetical protein